MFLCLFYYIEWSSIPKKMLLFYQNNNQTIFGYVFFWIAICVSNGPPSITVNRNLAHLIVDWKWFEQNSGWSIPQIYIHYTVGRGFIWKDGSIQKLQLFILHLNRSFSPSNINWFTELAFFWLLCHISYTILSLFWTYTAILFSFQWWYFSVFCLIAWRHTSDGQNWPRWDTKFLNVFLNFYNYMVHRWKRNSQFWSYWWC